MSKPRLSTGRIPAQLGIGVDGPTDEQSPVSDITIYDELSPTGPISGGAVQNPDVIYD